MKIYDLLAICIVVFCLVVILVGASRIMLMLDAMRMPPPPSADHARRELGDLELGARQRLLPRKCTYIPTQSSILRLRAADVPG